MEEYKFQVTIVPESYDYGEEEIVYRIYIDDQLISERSLPILQHNQALLDTFYINTDFLKMKHFKIINCKEKKVKFKHMNVNDLFINFLGGKLYKKINLSVSES